MKLSEKLLELLLNPTSKSLKDIEKLMNTTATRDLINELLIKINKSSLKLETDDLQAITAITNAADLIYQNSGDYTGLSDSEYDLFKSTLERFSDLFDLSDTFSSTFRQFIDIPVGNEIIDSTDTSTVHHKFPALRGTLAKIYKLTDDDKLKNSTEMDFNKWLMSISSSSNISREELLDEDVLVMPKFDGVSCILEFDKNGELKRALTRGNSETNEAQDRTSAIMQIYKKYINHDAYDNEGCEYAVKTEVMVLDKDLDEYNRLNPSNTYKSTRSLCNSIITSPDEKIKYLRLIPLRYAVYKDNVVQHQKLSPEIYNYPTYETKLKNLDDIRDFSLSCKNVFPGYRCDGSVIYFKNQELQKKLGRKNHKNIYEVAYKFTEETGYSEVVDILFNIGFGGKLSQVVQFKPIKLKGNTVQKAAINSSERFKKLNLAIGDTVKIAYDIIPYVIFDEHDPNCKRSNNTPVDIPTRCPICNEPLEQSVDSNGILGNLCCVNSSCPSRLRGRIVSFAETVDIEGLFIETVSTLYDEGYLSSIVDIYRLHELRDTISKLPGFGKRRTDKLLKSIEDHRSLSPELFMGAIGIDGFRIKKFKDILSVYSINDLLDIAKKKNRYTELCKVPHISDKGAYKLWYNLNNQLSDIRELLTEVDVNTDIILKENDTKFRVAFSKFRDKSLEELITSLGGSVDDRVYKDTDLLIIPNMNVTSSNVVNANKYNIKIIDKDNAISYLKSHY